MKIVHSKNERLLGAGTAAKHAKRREIELSRELLIAIWHGLDLAGREKKKENATSVTQRRVKCNRKPRSKAGCRG